jgi:hypothetical protein
VSKYARFENQGEQDLVSSENTYESKMNQGPASPAGDTAPMGNGFTPPPPNVDFLQDSGDSNTPF